MYGRKWEKCFLQGPDVTVAVELHVDGFHVLFLLISRAKRLMTGIL